MLKPEQVPDCVVEAYVDERLYSQNTYAAIAAAINAWPNGGLHVPVPPGAPRKSFTLPAIILPVSLENTNAEA